MGAASLLTVVLAGMLVQGSVSQDVREYDQARAVNETNGNGTEYMEKYGEKLNVSDDVDGTWRNADADGDLILHDISDDGLVSEFDGETETSLDDIPDVSNDTDAADHPLDVEDGDNVESVGDVMPFGDTFETSDHHSDSSIVAEEPPNINISHKNEAGSSSYSWEDECTGMQGDEPLQADGPQIDVGWDGEWQSDAGWDGEWQSDAPTAMDDGNNDGDHPGVSLAFVFDSTGSMWDDLVQVKAGAEKIMATMLEREDKPVYNYVLVPFHDPKVGPVTVTTDHEKFRQSLQAIDVTGGGDCPEMSVSAVKLALQASRRNSFVYVFTDARSKDFHLLQDVLQLIQRKKSQVVYVLTGDCGDKSHQGYQVYEKIAATSSGQVYHLKKDNVEEVLTFVRESLQSRRVNLLSLNRPGPARTQLPLLVDESLKEFTVSVSGTNPHLGVVNPGGKVVIGKPLLDLENVKVVNVQKPDPGRWKLDVGSDSEHMVRSTGLSDLDFTAGFSVVPAQSMEETAHRPLKGSRNTVLIQVSHGEELHNLTYLRLTDLKGKVLQDIPLSPASDKLGLFKGSRFIPPSDFFHLSIYGFGKDGFPVERMSPTAVSAQRPDLPHVSMRPEVTGWINEPVTLKCHIESLIPFKLMWAKDGVPISPNKQYEQTAEVLWHLPVVSKSSEGNYTCRATNVAGSSTRGSQLTVTGPAPQVETPPQVISPPNKAATLNCSVRSLLEYKVAWARVPSDTATLDNNEAIQYLRSDGKLKTLPNGTLVINSVKVGDEGWYMCIATSKGGKTEGKVYLAVREPIQVKVSPEKFDYQQQESFVINCHATGTPKPTLRWKKNGENLQASGRTRIRQQERKSALYIEDADGTDAGVYQCIAENDMDLDVALSEARFVEAPLITAEEARKTVKVGDEVTLTCIATGTPTPIIIWSKDGHDLQPDYKFQLLSDGSLLIAGVKLSDAGDFTCMAQNELGVEEDFVTVDVGVAPQLVQPPRDVDITIGGNGTIPCIAIGLPVPKITWIRQDGRVLNPSRLVVTEAGNLQVTGAKLEDNGTYICRVENGFGEAQLEASIRITGLVKPVLDASVASYPDLMVVRGEPAELPCRLLLGNPSPTISWYKDGQLLDREASQWEGIQMNKNGSIVIVYTTQNHEGVYECVATNVVGTARQSSRLHVLEPPSFSTDAVASEVHYKVITGQRTVLPCSVSGDPKPIVTWQKNGMPLQTDHMVFVNESDNSLVITDLKETDSGTYKCTAVNSAGTGSKAMAVFVQSPPQVEVSNGEVWVVQGQAVTLYCEVKAMPAPVITWYKDGIMLIPSRRDMSLIGTSAKLRFVANVSDSGTYTCEAVNEAGSDNKDITVVVLVPPSLYPPDDEFVKANASQDVVLVCQVSGYPTPRVVWQRNGADISNDTSVRLDGNGTLTIPNVQLNAAGVYICDAENQAGIQQKIFYLVVHVPPKIRENFPSHIKLMEGEDYSLACSADGSPMPFISWKKNDQAIIGTNENVTVLDDGTLVMISATQETTGVYSCVAENIDGIDQRHFVVEVLVPPTMMDSEAIKLEVVEGDSVIITCPAVEAVPPPVILWQRDGQPLDLLTNERSDVGHYKLTDGGVTLKIEEAHPLDSGDYVCIATNLAGQTEAAFSLDVLMIPYFDEFNYQQEKTVTAGTQLKLECLVTGNPPPRVSWRKNNIPITPHSTPGAMLSPNKQVLYIPTTRAHDAGHYQCAADNKVGRRDRDFHVSVNVPPDVDGPEEEQQEVVLGEPALLQCPILGTPDPVIKWTKDGLDLKVNKDSEMLLSNDKKILDISSITKDDEGTYYCLGKNDAGSKYKHFNVTVLEPPRIVQEYFIEEITVKEGENHELHCKTRGNPKPDVTWLHNGRILKTGITKHLALDSKDEDVERSGLNLENVDISSGGKYTCLASNKAGVAEKNYRVKIIVAPKISNSWEDTNMIESFEGMPVTIKCPVVGSPAPDIYWMKDSHPLDEEETMEEDLDGQMLHINHIRLEHSGNYTCIAQNNAGNISKSFQLDVFVPPSMTEGEEETDYQVTTGDTLTLHCNVSGHPPPTILWLKGATAVDKYKWPNVTFEDYNQTLVIPEVTLKHDGQYSCLAINMAGTTELTFNVEVQEPPQIDDDAVNNSNYSAKLHRRLVLRCPISGSPQPKITWYKDGVPIYKEANVHISSDGKQLHLMQAQLSSAGEYSCLAENSAGSEEIFFNVTVTVPAKWSEWSVWSECSTTCGPGEQLRARVCGENVPAELLDHSDCLGEAEESQQCHQAMCPVDGGWSEWSEWTSCSESCGPATRRRYRQCDSPHPSFGGQPCVGSDAQQQDCRQAPCPVRGGWSQWSDWSACSASCDQGTKYRARLCDSPAPAYGGEGCEGTDVDFIACNTHKCPVDGGWSSWGSWTPCSVTCGFGNRRRYRSCSEPAPRFKGAPCSGENLQIEKCSAKSCKRVPQVASLRLKGQLNGHDLKDKVITANISDKGPKRTVSASMNGVDGQEAGWYPYLPVMLSPVSWNTAYELDEANNGYSLTNGNFQQHSQVEFASGEELVLTHTGRGLDKDGALIVEIEVHGEVPLIQPDADVVIEPFEEDYVQTSPNSLYTTSASMLSVDGQLVPYTWNNTVSYNTQGTMPYLVEKLYTKDIGIEYDPSMQEMKYVMSTVIKKKYEDDKCPEGFFHDEEHMHCRDFDECQEKRSNQCHYTQVCENLFGSYRCYCRPGYQSTGVGQRCRDMNECLMDPPVCSHQCRNLKGSYKCVCPRGYSLLPDSRTCSETVYWGDQHDAASGSQHPPSSNNYLPAYGSQKLQEWSAAEELWSCPHGFHVVNGICKDIDECTRTPGVCSSEQLCLNIKGSFRCLDTPCPNGYDRDPDTRNCIKFCDEPGVYCKDGAKLMETMTYTLLSLDSANVQPYQDLMELVVYGEDGRKLPRTKFRIIENEAGKPFRVRHEEGKGVLYILKPIKQIRLYRILVQAFSYDEGETHVLYATKFAIFIQLHDTS